MTTAKDQLRLDLLAARRAQRAPDHDVEAAALAETVRTLVVPSTVCAYVPVGTEPGAVTMIEALRDAGARVLLPIAVTDAGGAPMPLHWAEYRPGELAPARYGLLEPGGIRLPPEALTQAGLVLVPALAVDRRGIRLGRGGGFYDRSLPLRDPEAQLMAVVRDDELLEVLPGEEHDVPMTHALTPGRGVVVLG